jgi:hypothetical protein
MSTASVTQLSSDEAYLRQGKPMMMFPVIVMPFLMALFFLGKGGKGERHIAQDEAANQAGSGGFNAQMPNAKGGSIDGRDVEGPGYGKSEGQKLSVFFSAQKDSATAGLKPIAGKDSINTTAYASSLGSTAPNQRVKVANGPNAAALVATGRPKGGRAYSYQPPRSGPYYTASATDQQLDYQLQAYERSQKAPSPNLNATQPRSEAISAPVAQDDPAATVQLSDNLTASRLNESPSADDVFHTAPTGGSRPQPNRAVLSGGNSYGSKKTIAWMIPVVVHEDQAIRDGQQVKLRLLKEITADGITIPTNTILYAICQLSDDRLRLTVRNLQLGGQLIPLDLDVYDTDGSMGVNVPGLSQNAQVGGQVRSSAIQGVQLPGIGGLANTVLNSARMGASNSLRQATIRLRAGYNLFLKAQ